MVSVSENLSFSICLNKEIDCGKICQEIQNLVNSFLSRCNSPDASGALVRVEIKEMVDAKSDYHIPKLEHQNICTT